MSRTRVLFAIAPLLVGALLFYNYGGHRVPAGQAPLAYLTRETLPGLRQAFNAAATEVRVLVLLSPT